MLPEELTLLDGTEVITVAGIARLSGIERRLVHTQLTSQMSPETVLDGEPYYDRGSAFRVVAVGA